MAAERRLRSDERGKVVLELVEELLKTPGAVSVDVTAEDPFMSQHRHYSFSEGQLPEKLSVFGRVSGITLSGEFKFNHVEDEEDNLTGAIYRARQSKNLGPFRAVFRPSGNFMFDETRGEYVGDIDLQYAFDIERGERWDTPNSELPNERWGRIE